MLPLPPFVPGGRQIRLAHPSPSFSIFRTSPQCLQCTASRSWRVKPQLGHLKCTLLGRNRVWRSEEHTSELQSLMRISYAVFCLKKKKHKQTKNISQY